VILAQLFAANFLNLFLELVCQCIDELISLFVLLFIFEVDNPFYDLLARRFDLRLLQRVGPVVISDLHEEVNLALDVTLVHGGHELQEVFVVQVPTRRLDLKD